MSTVLGISAFYHDSAAALVRDGEIVAAAQEERFSRKKHDPRFPFRAINYCLEEAFLEAEEIDAVVYYDNAAFTFDRIVKNAIAAAPGGEAEWIRALRAVIGVKARVSDYVEKALGIAPQRLLACDHHMAHAASAFYPSPFEEAAILTVDGVGEWSTCSIGKGDRSGVQLLEEVHYPHSLGLLYSAFTYYCGFKVNSGEYKLMGLAPYGSPRFADRIRDSLLDLRSDGSFRLNTEFFGFLDTGTMTNQKFHDLFGGPPRNPESRITRREMDLAASVQVVLEEAMMGLVQRAVDRSGLRKLVMAGGVALNCVANGRILRESGLEGLWIQPAAGDAGGALGAALLVAHEYFHDKRDVRPESDSQKGSYLGPAYSSEEVRAFLDRHDYPYEHLPDEARRIRLIAEALADGRVIGYFKGRMEFGPRALGARSILGDARRPETQSVMNLKIKYRESFRPFAPVVLKEDAAEYFELADDSPYMLLVAPVREALRRPVDWTVWQDGGDDMLAILHQRRSDLPAITHVDGSARVQTVDGRHKPDMHLLLREFRAITSCAVLVNTSFNVRGEPIVCNPPDAYRCFMRTEMDLLVLEDCILRKSDQPAWTESADWRLEHELD